MQSSLTIHSTSGGQAIHSRLSKEHSLSIHRNSTALVEKSDPLFTASFLALILSYEILSMASVHGKRQAFCRVALCQSLSVRVNHRRAEVVASEPTPFLSEVIADVIALLADLGCALAPFSS